MRSLFRQRPSRYPWRTTKPQRLSGSDRRVVAPRKLSFDVLEDRRLLSVSYSIADLGTLSGYADSEATAINDKGQVVGWAKTASGVEHAFLYSNGKMTDLGTLPAYSDSGATAINDSGEVVGWAKTSGGSEDAFLYQNGTMTDLGAGCAYGINDSGQVVGAAGFLGSGQSYNYAFLYSNGKMTDLGTLSGFLSSVATSINASAQVAGYATTASGETDPFLYSNGTMTDLNPHPVGWVGGGNSFAYGINDSGQVVGVADHLGSAQIYSDAFLYSNGKMTDLGTLPGGNDSYAYGINDTGQVAGYADTASGDEHAFLYSNGTMTDLGTLPGGNDSYAYGINDSGQVVGEADTASGALHAVLFNPATATTTTVSALPNPSLYGQSVTFTATITPSTGTFDNGGTVQFQVDGTNFDSPVTVSNGQATIQDSTLTVSGSPHTITAIYSGDTNFSGSTGTLSGGQTVDQASTTTAVSSSSNPSALGQSVTFTATVTPGTGTFDNGGTVQFQVDGTDFDSPVTVSNGQATIQDLTLTVSGSPHTITAIYSGDTNFSSSSGTLSGGQTVTPPAPTISWPAPAAITYGTPLSSTQLDATASVPGSFVYTPAAGAVLKANTQPQTLSVFFTPTDTTDYATVSQTTTIVVKPATPTVSWPTPAAITYGTALGGTQLDASASWTVGGTLGSVAGTCVYTPTAGTVLKASTQPQTLSVTFTPTDTTDYTTVTQTTTIVVNPATPTMSWPTPAAITYGTVLGGTQLDASASWTVGGTLESVAGTCVYTPTAGTVLKASTQPQTLSVTFTPTDTTDYTTVTQTTTIVVNPATPTMSWPTPAAITYGTALGGTQLDASASWTVGGALASVAGTCVYTPAAGTVLKANTQPQTLSVTFTPTDTTDYTTVTQTTTIVVNRATPTVSWPMPAAIAYGTVLGGTQLDASASWTVGGAFASVTGTCVYTPTAGTVLPMGIQTLSTLFTPADTTDYTTVTGSTKITIVGPVSPSKSTITLSSSPIASGGTATVTLTARDANGNQEPGGGLKVVFKISGRAGGKIGKVTDNKNGTYTATFTAGTKVGNDTITAKIGRKAVTSKARMTVVPGAVRRSPSTIALSPSTIASGGQTTAPLATAAPYPAGTAPSPGGASTSGLAIDAAVRALLLDSSTVMGKVHSLFDP